MSKKIEIVENQRTAATLCKTSLVDVRRAKREGCAAFRLGGRIVVAELRQWLKENPRPKSKVVKANLQTGATANLARLADEEAGSYSRMVAESDPEERERLRRSWIATGDALRKADAALDAARRDAGAFVTRQSVVDSLNVLGQFLIIAANAQTPQVAFDIIGLEEQVDRYNLLQKCVLSQAVVSYCGIEAMGVPRWMLDALQKHLLSYTNVTSEYLTAMAGAIHDAAEADGKLTIARHVSDCAVENAKWAKPPAPAPAQPAPAAESESVEVGASSTLNEPA